MAPPFIGDWKGRFCERGTRYSLKLTYVRSLLIDENKQKHEITTEYDFRVCWDLITGSCR